MDTPLIDERAASIKTQADRFRAMATQLELNGGVSFGGAFVIIPPAEGGEPIETLILDSQQDPAQFWSILKTKAEIVLDGLKDRARQQRAFNR